MEELTAKDLMLIEGHLWNRLSDTEVLEFQQRMKEEHFQKNIAIQKEIINAVQNKEVTVLKELLVAEEKNILMEQATIINAQNKKNSYQKWLAIAASFLIFITISYLILIRFSTTPNYYAEFFTPYPNVIVHEERSTAINSTELNAFKAYDNDEFELALSEFNRLEDIDVSSYIFFYKANALMELGKVRDAIPLLERIIKDNGNHFYQHAIWYKALAHLHQKELDKTKENLQLLIDISNSRFKQEAITLNRLISSENDN